MLLSGPTGGPGEDADAGVEAAGGDAESASRAARGVVAASGVGQQRAEPLAVLLLPVVWAANAPKPVAALQSRLW